MMQINNLKGIYFYISYFGLFLLDVAGRITTGSVMDVSYLFFSLVYSIYFRSLDAEKNNARIIL